MKFVDTSWQIVSAIAVFSFFINFVNEVFFYEVNEVVAKISINTFLFSLIAYAIVGAIKLALTLKKYIKGL